MMKHPDAKTLNDFRTAKLPAATLLEVSDHVSACATCQAEVAAGAHAPGASALEAFLADGGGSHLSEEELAEAAINADRLPRETQQHLQACAACQTEVEDARAFAAHEPRAKPTAKSSHAGWKAWALPAAAALLVAATLVGLRARHQTNATTIASLRDGNTDISLTADGHLLTQENLSTRQKDLLAQVMRDGRLPIDIAAQTTAPPSHLRGISSSSPAFQVLTPLGTARSQPVFRWQPLATAKSYRVEIYDAQFHKVTGSGPLQASTWKPSTPLQPATEYTWVVRAITPTGEVQAPVPPAQEARFHTVDADTEHTIAAVESQGSPLLLAAVYARAGLVESAREQLDLLERKNPGSTLVTQLRASLPSQGLPSSTNPAQ